MSKPDIRFMQKLIDSMVGEERFTYPARKNAPRPKENFATVALIEQYNIGIPYEVSLPVYDSNNDQIGILNKYYTAVTLRFRIGMYGTDGTPSIKVSAGWTTEKSKRLYIEEGYGYLKDTPISIEDELLEKDWNPRQGFSVFISTTRIVEDCVSFINTVGLIQGCYYEDGKFVEININTNPRSYLQPSLIQGCYYEDGNFVEINTNPRRYLQPSLVISENNIPR